MSWGAGVKGEATTESQMSINNAKNIAQADIAPYMSALLGINFPVNNVVSMSICPQPTFDHDQL